MHTRDQEKRMPEDIGSIPMLKRSGWKDSDITNQKYEDYPGQAKELGRQLALYYAWLKKDNEDNEKMNSKSGL